MLTSFLLAACGSPSSGKSAVAPTPDRSPATSTPDRAEGARDISASLKALEAQFDARVGIVAIDTGTTSKIEYRADTRFGYASALKAFAAAQFLHAVDPRGREERVTWSKEDVAAAGYSPVTSKHIPDGLTLAQLAESAVRESDNTAMNLVLQRIGGPAGLDFALSRLGDTTTEVVNTEPDLNTIEPGTSDDTTTPAAFTADLAADLDGPVLNDSDRTLLIDWMSGNATGDSLIRAGAPKGWAVADKSGGAGAIRNDVALVTPPGRDPIVITILTTKNNTSAKYDDELVARAADWPSLRLVETNVSEGKVIDAQLDSFAGPGTHATSNPAHSGLSLQRRRPVVPVTAS